MRAPTVICLTCRRSVTDRSDGECWNGHQCVMAYSWDVWRVMPEYKTWIGTIDTLDTNPETARRLAIITWGRALYAVKEREPEDVETLEQPEPQIETAEIVTEQPEGSDRWIAYALVASLILAAILSTAVFLAPTTSPIGSDLPTESAPR